LDLEYKNNPLVTVIIPLFNTEKYIAEAVESVLCQSYKNWELIVVDDYSTDGSINIASKYVAKDKRIRLIESQSNSGGAAKPRNIGLEYANGEYVAFLDADDIWLPQKIERQVALMEQNKNYALCYCDYEKINANGEYISFFKTKHPNGYIFDKQLSWYEIGMSTVLVRLKMLKETPLPQFNHALFFCQDYDLLMRIVAKYEICSIKECFMRYRIIGSSITNTTKANHSKELISALHTLEEVYPELYRKYKLEFWHAYRWASIMEANYLISAEKIGMARKSLRIAKTASRKHFMRYLVSFMPTFIAFPIYKKYFDIG